jgi:hypothetical protein
MPPAPPVRPAPNAYHFHTYDYQNSAANGPWGLSPAQPTAGGWQFYSLVQDLAGLAALGAARNVPNILLSDVGGPTRRGRRTKMLSFGNQGSVAGRPTVVITGGIHAREWIATEMAYLLAEYLIVNYPVGIPPNPRVAQLRNLVRTRNIHIIPMVNPDGNRRTVFGTGANDRVWRKNRRRLPAVGGAWIAALAPGGVPTAPFANVQYWTLPLWAQYRVPDFDPVNHVPPAGPANYRNHKLGNLEIGVDLNRNMPTTGWGYDCPPGLHLSDPADEQFFGTRPGGEPETSNVQQAMVNAAAGANIAVTIDYHSYGRMILYPGEVHHAGAITALHQSTGQMLDALIRNQNPPYQMYQLGDPLTVVGYDATGTVADYAAQQHQARSFTIELEPSRFDPAGFTLPEADIQAAFEKNIRGALAAIGAPATALEATNYAAQYAWNVSGHGNRVP